LAQGIEFLHEYGIFIGLLNLSTIMMTDKSDQAIPKIYNLSQASILLPGQKSKDDIKNSPTSNFPPEIIIGNAYDHKVDTWSFGVILYYLLTGEKHVKYGETG
jgi:novel protein kinase C theta type